MKKLLAIVLSVTMLLSLGVVFASADGEVTERQVELEWADMSEIVFDGDMSDWQDLDLTPLTLTASDFVSWTKTTNAETGEVTGDVFPEFGTTAYFAVDDTYLYVGLYVTDPDFVYGLRTNGNSEGIDFNTASQASYNGDAFQIAIDFNAQMREFMETNPDEYAALDGQSKQLIFYSFSCLEDTNDMVIVSQNGASNRLLNEDVDKGSKGAAAATDEGWCAEFRLNLEVLHKDISDKVWGDPEVAFDSANPLKMGVTLCYLDHTEASGTGVAAAWGTWNAMGDGVEGVQWAPSEAGITATLEWAEGRELSSSIFVQGGDVGDVTEAPVDTAAPADTNAAPADTNAAEDTNAAPADTNAAEDTNAPAADTNAAANTGAAGTEAPADDGGCASVVGAGAAVVVLSAVAAAVALKKKED